MARNLESLMKLGKEVLVGMVLDYKDKFDITLMNINKELTDLRNKVRDIFCECDADIDPVIIEACHRLKSNHWSKKRSL